MLEKRVVVDRIEVLEGGAVQVRTATRIVEVAEDGKENVISSTYHRHVVDAGADYSNEDPKVQAVCAAVRGS